MPIYRKRSGYKNIVQPLTIAEKTIIASLVYSGHTPTQACQIAGIDVHRYSGEYLADVDFRRDINDCMAGKAQMGQDKMFELGMNGDSKALESSLINLSRHLPKDSPYKWVATGWAPEDDTKGHDAEKAYFLDVLKFQKERLKDQLPKDEETLSSAEVVPEQNGNSRKKSTERPEG